MPGSLNGPSMRRRRVPREVWPRSKPELVELQTELAASRPPLWHPSEARPMTAGCFVCFQRGLRGRGRAGEPGWAAAALIRGNRGLVASAVATGEAGGPYEPGLL